MIHDMKSLLKGHFAKIYESYKAKEGMFGLSESEFEKISWRRKCMKIFMKIG